MTDPDISVGFDDNRYSSASESSFERGSDDGSLSEESLYSSERSEEESGNEGVEILVESDNEIIESTGKRTIKKRNSVDYVHIETFLDYDAAHNYMIHNNYSKDSTKITSEGMKTYYRCKAVPKKNGFCPAKRMLFQPNTSKEFQIFSATCDHDHSMVPNTQKKRLDISDEMKEEITSLYSFQMKPRQIINYLKKQQTEAVKYVGETIPNKSQLQYILKKYRKEKCPEIITIGELSKWCEEHSSVPTDSNETFVLDYEQSDEEENEGNLFFRFVLSTKNLIQKFASLDKFCVDATYKLNWLGCPLFVVGTVDQGKIFHPLCFAVCSSESTEDYKFIFKTISDTVEKLTKSKFEPTVMIADGADAIRNAFYSVFPSAKIDIMCWAHVIRNVNKQTFRGGVKAKNAVLNDLRILQLSCSEEIFERNSKLFLKKWMKKEPDFVKYFNKQWLGVHKNWYEGAAEYTPSTNNGLEAFNGVIKSNYTFRNRLKFAEFIDVMSNVAQKISIEFESNERRMLEYPEIDSKLWKASYEWAKNEEIGRVLDEEEIYFVQGSTDTTEIEQFDHEYCIGMCVCVLKPH